MIVQSTKAVVELFNKEKLEIGRLRAVGGELRCFWEVDNTRAPRGGLCMVRNPFVSLTIFCLFLFHHAYLFIFTTGSAIAETVGSRLRLVT